MPLRLAYGALRGIGPVLAEEALGRTGFRAVREGFWCSLPRLAADRSRSAWRVWGLRGIGPALAEEALGRMGFRAVRWGFWCSLPRLASDRSRFAWRMGGSAGSVPCSLRKLLGRMGFRAVREGFLVIAFNARSGSVPLPLERAGFSGKQTFRCWEGFSGGWGRCLAWRRFGRINCATWRLLIVPRSGPGDLMRVLLLLARALARVLGRARVRQRCRRPIRRIGRRRGSG